jgi:hypothetical protein
MAKETTLSRSGAEADVPWEVQITVTVVSHRRCRSLRGLFLGTKSVVAVCVVGFGLAAAASGAMIFGAAQGGDRHPPNRIDAARRDRAAVAEVAAAYGYPPRCMSVTIAAGARTYAQAELDGRRACAAYHGYVNATFHRVNGKWRLVLDEGQLFVPNKLLTRCRAAWPSCQPVPHGVRAARASKRPHW